MPCFTLTLFKANTVYNLEQMIKDQFDVDPAGYEAVASMWPEIIVQSSFENVNSKGEPILIKYGDLNLSGIRYGRQIVPGEVIKWGNGTKFTGTRDKNFMCEEADNVSISVELAG
jgi:hypothetical protein